MMSSRSASNPTQGPTLPRVWSIERRGVDLPGEVRALPQGALLLVVTDDGSDPVFARTRRSAIELARTIHARILFYDRSAESRFVDPYASGTMTAETRWSHGERMLEPAELDYLGRDYLVEQVREAAVAGVQAWAWLPKGVGAASVAEAVRRFGCDLVVVPAELGQGTTRTRVLPGTRPVPAQPVPVLAAGADGSLQAWQFATELSRVEFAARQFGILNVRGQFSDFEVRLEFDEAAPEATKVEARIAAASLSTGIGLRDRDLRGRSFFDVERHPLITFVSSRVWGSGPSYRISGDLEIKGLRRQVELDGRFEGIGAARGYRRATMRATATVDRRNWDLVGGVLVGEQVTLTIDAVAVRASGESVSGSSDARSARTQSGTPDAT